MRELPDVVPDAKAPAAAALVRRIAEVYRIRQAVPSEIARRAKLKDRSGPSRWSRGELAIGPRVAEKLRAAFPDLASEINEAVRSDHVRPIDEELGGTSRTRTRATLPEALAAIVATLDAPRRQALLDLAHHLARGGPGDWVDRAVARFAGAADVAAPLSAHAEAKPAS